MPIKAENRSRYPSDWKAISERIRFERAGGQCECKGECGVDHSRPVWLKDRMAEIQRCSALHDRPHPVTRSRVVLTVAHLDHVPENCDPENLRAMCQRCHLRYDARHHASNAAATRRRRKEDHGQTAIDFDAEVSR